MSLLRKLAGETAIYGSSHVLNRLLNFIIVTPYLTRVFEQRQEEYGIHGLMYAFAALLMVVLTYGMETAYFRFASHAPDRQRTFSTVSLSLLFTTSVFTFFLVFFSPEVAGVLTRPSDAKYVVYFAFIIAFDVLAAVPFARLRLENRPVRFALIRAANVLVNGGLILFYLELLPHLQEPGGLPWMNYQPDRELEYVFRANLIASAFTLALLFPAYFGLRLRFDFPLWKKMLRYALPLILVGVAGMINQLADRYLLTHWLPGSLQDNLHQVGIYNACAKIAVLMSLLIQAFKYASEPFFFRHARREDAQVVYAEVGRAFTLVGSLAFLGIMLYIDLVKYLIAPSYWEGLKVVPLLLLAYLFLGIYYNFAVWYKLTDRTGLGALISVGGAVITILLNYWLIPRIGYLGSAWASLCCFLFMTIASWIMGKRYYPVPYPLVKMGTYIFLAVAVYGISQGLNFLWSEPLPFFERLLLHTVLLLFFGGLVALMEREALRRWLSRMRSAS